MPRLDIGPRGYHQAQAAATLSFTPLNDRAAQITRILIDKPSAGDIWRVSVQGRELAAFDLRTTGNQQPLAGPYSGYPKNNDIFEVYNYLTNRRLTYPVPMGMTFTVASDGGATANITLSYEELYQEEVTQAMVNHPQGSHFVLPLIGYRAATVNAAGEADLDTQIGPKWFPNIFATGLIPPKWRINVLAYFLEGGGRNTFSGAADHQSVTTYLMVKKNGMRLYTRDALGGIPLVGQASAAGSANTVVGTDLATKPPFQESDVFDMELEAVPFMLGDGDSYEFALNVSGDVTGNADYSLMRQMFLCDVVAGS